MKIQRKWVKKKASSREWNSYYSQISSYCFLEKEGGEVWIGFLLALSEEEQLPRHCEDIEDNTPSGLEHLRIIDHHRKTNNIFPRPLQQIQKETNIEDEEERQKVIKKLDEMKLELKKSKIIK